MKRAESPTLPDGMYDIWVADGSMMQVYCDMSNGGWTRVFSNTFTSNHDGVTYNIDCPCGSNAGMNNGAYAIDSNGWHLGVTQCHNGNQLSDTISGSSVSYSWRMTFDTIDIGPVNAVRHTGVHQNNHGYDWINSWPAGAQLTHSNHMARNGEFMSAVLNTYGSWNWYARYNLGSFDVNRYGPSIHPYFTFLYSGGGPGGCSEGNSDGFDIKNYEIYVM